MFSREKERFIIPEIPKGYDAHPFSVGREFTMPENLVNLLDDSGFDFNEYEDSFIVPPQAYPKHWFAKRYVPWQALLFKEKVIIHAKDSLILDESGTVNKVSADNLAYLKLNLCLLYGKLDIVCSNGKDATRVEVEYNTVAHNILEPNLERFLKANWHKSKASSNGKDVYGRLKNIPTKYRNGIYIYVLQKDEVLLDFIYLPKLVHKIFFSKINLIPDILFAITDRQLVILEEDLSHTSSYTWLLTYIPLNNIRGISFEKQNRFTKVKIKIKKNDLSEELSSRIEDKYTDDIKRFLEVLIK